MGSPDASRPLIRCNCDCKAITTAICFGLHRYSMRCIHSAQRCVSSRQMRDHIFEIETAAHYAYATSDSGILLTDFACAYPSVNHSWIFHVLEKAGLSMFVQQFLRMFYNNSVTAGGVRKGCPASGFLFVMAFDPIFRVLQNSVIPRGLPPVPCAYADDFAVAALSFRSLMPASSPAFKAFDCIAVLNLNHRKCYWVQYGTTAAMTY